MIEEFRKMQADEKTRGAVAPAGWPTAITGALCRSARIETSRSGFNKFIYENFRENLAGQEEVWNRMAVRNPNPEIAHALCLKAEGLGYALRLLYAFEPEFRELVECASLVAAGETIRR